jgi:hypothetical protein
MKRVILMLLFVVLSKNVMAEWVKVVSNDDVQVTIYADPDTITRHGDKVTISTLWDYKTNHRAPSGEPVYRSVGYEKIYDCNGSQSITKSFEWYSENMGGGDGTYHDRKWTHPFNWRWTAVNPGEMEYDLFKYACEQQP